MRSISVIIFRAAEIVPQVARNRLLLQQQLQAQALDVALLAVDLARPAAAAFSALCFRRFVLQRCGTPAEIASSHSAPISMSFSIQQLQLLVKPASHHPNLPVM